VLQRHGDVRWFQLAVLSSEAGSSVEMIRKVVSQRSSAGDTAEWRTAFIADASTVIGSHNRAQEVKSFLNLIAAPAVASNQPLQTAALEGLVKGLKKSKSITPELKQSLEGVQLASADGVQQAITLVKHSYQKK
jgi:hypothetical protein